MRFIYSILICISFLATNAQDTSTVSRIITLIDIDTDLPISFATIDNHQLTDIKGNVKLTSGSHSGHHPEYGHFDFNTSNDTIETPYIHNTEKLYFSNYHSKEIIKQTISNKTVNKPEAFAPFKYHSYNKFYIYTNKTQDTKNLVNHLLAPFSVTLKEYNYDHHIILSESSTERIYKGPMREEEVVTASKISGVDHPLLISLNSQVQTFSYYNDYIRVGAKDYVGPLAKGSLNRYHYKIIDTLVRKTDNLYTIQFYPKQYKYFESLKGYLFINSEDYALEHCIISPARDAENQIQILHSSTKLHDGWFPKTTITSLAIQDIGKEKAQFTIRAESHITNVEANAAVKNKFSDIAVYYEEHSFDSTHDWNTLRPVPLTKKDANTYTFYDSIGQINNFTQAINFGEHIYFQKIPLKNINIQVEHLVHYNDHVGPQLGFGASSNENFSEAFELSGYLKYGFNDKESKYGTQAKYTLPFKRKSDVCFSFTNDLREAGIHPSFFYKNMYNTEWLRKLKLNKFDRVKKTNLAIYSNPFNYFFITTGVSHEISSLNFNYSYSSDSIDQFTLNTFNIGIKYAYGERYFKLLNERISLGRPFPIVWLEYKRNINILNNNFQFEQLYGKAEYKLNLLGYGTLGLQLIAGKTWGDLPYSRLYNGKGSLGVRTVAHNSFETMNYNEFISSDFIFVFVSHDFGYFNFLNNKYFKPRVELIYNMGWGQLNNQNQHNTINVKTLEKGYFEFGTMVNNLLIIRINPTKLGIGVGYFHRLGANRNDGFSNNSFFKLSTTFKL